MRKVSLPLLLVLCAVFINTSFALNAQEIYQKVSKSVYTIYTVNFYDRSPESLGSAIAVTDHILATNCHVALTGNYLGIVLDNEFKLGTIFFRDVSRDICFVEVPGVVFTPIKIRSTKDVKVGEQVYAVGNPEGLEKSISQGIVSNKRKDKGGYILQTDAAVSFGSSGGGLFDQNGQLVGITNSIDRYSKNIAFAIPSEWITQILFPKKVPAGQYVENKTSSQPTKPIQKLGIFGKDKMILYQFNKKCFVLLQGKNEYGEFSGSAIWYPEKPGIILIFPTSQDINKNIQIMNKAFYGDEDETPTYSGDYLYALGKKYELVGIKSDNGSFPLLVTKIPVDSKDAFLKMGNFVVKYEDGVTVQGFTKVTYGLDGLKDTLSTYGRQCKIEYSDAKTAPNEVASQQATNQKKELLAPRGN
jgi:serine protease Do